MPNSQILARRFGVHWDSDAYIATAYPITEASSARDTLARDRRPQHVAPTMMAMKATADDDDTQHRPFWRRLKRTTDNKGKSTTAADPVPGNKDVVGPDATSATNATAEVKISEIGKAAGNVTGDAQIPEKPALVTSQSSPQPLSASSSVSNQTVPVIDTDKSGAVDVAVPVTTLQTDMALPKNESNGSITTNATAVARADLIDSDAKGITEATVAVGGLNSSSNSVAAISAPSDSSVPVLKLDGDVNGSLINRRNNGTMNSFGNMTLTNSTTPSTVAESIVPYTVKPTNSFYVPKADDFNVPIVYFSQTNNNTIAASLPEPPPPMKVGGGVYQPKTILAAGWVETYRARLNQTYTTNTYMEKHFVPMVRNHIHLFEALTALIASLLTVIILHPLDVIRITQQAYAYSFTNTVSRIGKSYRGDTKLRRLSNFYRALPISMAAYILNYTIYFPLASWFKLNNPYTFNGNHILSYALCHLAVSVTTMTILYPLFTIRNIQISDHRKTSVRGPTPSIRSSMKQIRQRSGWKGFYLGMTAAYITSLEEIITFTLYDSLRDYIVLINWPSYLDYAMCAFVARTIAILVTYPFQVLQVRQQVHQLRPRKTLKDINLGNVYHGLTPTMVQTVPRCVIMMVIYERLLHFFITST